MEINKEVERNVEKNEKFCCVSMAEMITKPNTISDLFKWWATCFGVEIQQVASGYEMKEARHGGKIEDAICSVEDLITKANDLHDDAIDAIFCQGYVECPNCVGRFMCQNNK